VLAIPPVILLIIVLVIALLVALLIAPVILAVIVLDFPPPPRAIAPAPSGMASKIASTIKSMSKIKIGNARSGTRIRDHEPQTEPYHAPKVRVRQYDRRPRRSAPERTGGSIRGT